jgi:hypothetical protein
MPRNERALIEEMQQDLRAGLTPCRDYLAALDPLRRSELYTQLLFERLERKMKLTTELYEEAGGNWQQLFYLLYFRTLGDRKNQAAYLDLARRLIFDSLCNKSKRVDVLHFRTNAKKLLTALSNREIHVATELTLIHFAFGNTGVNEHKSERFEVFDSFIGRSYIRR